MSWLEWLLWKLDGHRAARTCRQAGHDTVGPELTIGGWYIYRCTRCPYRFRADETISA